MLGCSRWKNFYDRDVYKRQGVGNFFGMLPEEMRNSRLYGVELDPVSGRIAKQLYPKADITVK